MAVEKFGPVTKGNSRWLIAFEHYFLDLLLELLAFDLYYGHLDSSSLDDLVVFCINHGNYMVGLHINL